jgi:hypothetical protein
LLHRLAFLRAAGVRRQQTGDLRHGGKPCSRRRGFAEKRLSVFAEEEDGRGLAGVVGGFPVPAPEVSEASNAASIAARRIGASTRSPRSRAQADDGPPRGWQAQRARPEWSRAGWRS